MEVDKAEEIKEEENIYKMAEACEGDVKTSEKLDFTEKQEQNEVEMLQGIDKKLDQLLALQRLSAEKESI